MTDKLIRVGFIGAGRNTRERHIPGFQKQPGVEFVAVANRSRESGERVAKELAFVASRRTGAPSSRRPTSMRSASAPGRIRTAR